MRFDGSSFLTLKLHMRHEWSYVRSEFVILEGGKNLYSGKLTIKRPACDELYFFSKRTTVLATSCLRTTHLNMFSKPTTEEDK